MESGESPLHLSPDSMQHSLCVVFCLSIGNGAAASLISFPVAAYCLRNPIVIPLEQFLAKLCLQSLDRKSVV